MTQDGRIPNDDLGEWAELQFAALCAAGGLTPNKATRDKMGWDFLVQAPPPSAGGDETLDQRPNGLRCLVQIKAHWNRDAARIPVTLSAIERLAKDPGPAFIFVMTAEPGEDGGDPTLVGCRLIHMQGETLARVLKRLREAHADPKSAPLNDQTITFGETSGVAVRPQGKALRALLTTESGSDFEAYVTAKSHALKSLGYEAGRYKLQATFAVANIDELVEVMLGLKQADVSDLQATDVRFGIETAVSDLKVIGAAKALMSPVAVDTCKIRVKGRGLSAPAVFSGEVIMPPLSAGVPTRSLRMLIKAEHFTLDLRAAGTMGFSLDIKAMMQAELTLAEWRQAFRLLEILSEPEVEFMVQGDSPGSPLHVLPLTSVTPHPLLNWVPPLMATVLRGEALLRTAGAESDALSLQRLSDTAEAVDHAHMRMFDPASLTPQTFTSDGVLVPGEPVADLDMLMVDYAKPGGVTLGYACRVSVRPETAGAGLLWRQVDFEPLMIQVIEGTLEGFAAFAELAAERTGIRNTMIRAIDEEEHDETERAD